VKKGEGGKEARHKCSSSRSFHTQTTVFAAA